LRVNVTQNNEEIRTLEHYFRVIAPPTLIFFDRSGQQLPQETLVGETKEADFIGHLEKILEEN
jgi:thiol:disulfide interchange protein DsbD